MLHSSASCPITVHANILGSWVQCGDLRLREEEGRVTYATFSYSDKYFHSDRRPFCIDPVSLPAVGLADQRSAVPPAKGLALHGVFADLMPGTWGRRCIEEVLGQRNLTEIDFLMLAEGDRLGALDLATHQDSVPGASLAVSLERLPKITDLFSRLVRHRPVSSASLGDLSACLSLPGDRPKVSIRDSSGVLWLAKLSLPTDKLDIPELEFATLQLAQRCGISIPPINLVKWEKNSALLVRRFDRYWGNRSKPFTLLSRRALLNQKPSPQQIEGRMHTVSGAALLGVDSLTAHLFGWADLVEAYREAAFPLGLFGDLEELFRRAVFSIVLGVDQDPFSNTTFMFDSHRSGWRLAPYYGARSGCDSMARMPRKMGSLDREARLENLMSIRPSFNLKRTKAIDIISSVLEKMNGWESALIEKQISKITIEALRMGIRPIETIAEHDFLTQLAENRSK